MKSEAIVDRLNDFVNDLPRSYDRPQKKFFRDLLGGILISQSTILTDVCRALSTSNAEFKKNYKRLDRRLGEVDLEPAAQQQKRRAVREIHDNSIIAIDVGDIAKPAAKVMECLGIIADGSDDHRLKPGYWLLSAVAVDPRTQEKTPQPLELKMWSSTSEGFVSENAVLKELISEIHGMTHGKGIHVIDRGGDRGIILQHFFELDQSFIIRLKGRYLVNTDDQTRFLVNKREIHRDNLPFEASIQRQSDDNRKRSIMHVRYGFEPVKIQSLGDKTTRQLFLVTAWSATSEKPMYLLTNRPVTNADEALATILGYLSRWSVEETYRFYKTGQGLESMRLMTFGALKNMVHASFIVASILARMTRVTAWRRITSRVALRLKSAPERLYNWLYRFSDAISQIMAEHLPKLRALNNPILNTRQKGPIQRELFTTGSYL